MKIITIIGADASGKDTQIALLKKELEAQNKKVQVITIWDSLREFSAVPDKKALQEIVETFLLKYEGHARSFFLMACLRNSVSKIDSTNDVVLLNGFFHKYWASEMTYGVESALWEKNISEFVSSDKIIYLKTSAEKCLERKTSWSKYESGMGKFVGGQKTSDKDQFQKSMHQNLDTIAAQLKNVITIDGSESIENVAINILKAI